MNKKYLALFATSSVFLIFGAGTYIAESVMTSSIESRIQRELPKSSGVNVSIPLLDMPRNLTSNSIKSAEISVGSYALKGSNAESAINITANNISKSRPNLVGSLEVTATIPISTIAKESEFGDAQVVGNTLEVAAGTGRMGKAVLIPKYSSNQLYFVLKSVSLFGNEIPASSLPADLQTQIKSKSLRSLTPPKGLKVKSVSLSSRGLSIKMYGSNIQLGNLGL